VVTRRASSRPGAGREQRVELTAPTSGTPSSLGLGDLGGARRLPTTTQYVFLDTEPGEVPPRATIAASASSRVYPGTAPVTTTARPANAASSVDVALDSRKVSPAALKRSIRSRALLLTHVLVEGLSDHRTNAVAGLEHLQGRTRQVVVVGEAPGELARGDRSDVANAQTHQHPAERCGLGFVDLAHQRRRGELTETLERLELLHAQREEVGDVVDQSRLPSSWATRCSPSPSMSRAPREAKWTICSST
jgi:hypothetical protein